MTLSRLTVPSQKGKLKGIKLSGRPKSRLSSLQHHNEKHLKASASRETIGPQATG